MCKLRIRGRFFNYHIFNVHCPYEESPDGEKEVFYAKLEENFDSYPQRDVKIVIGDLNARIGREMYRPVLGSYSLHTVTNDNGQRCINFAASRGMVVRSTCFPRKDIHKGHRLAREQQHKLTTFSSTADFSRTWQISARIAVRTSTRTTT